MIVLNSSYRGPLKFTSDVISQAKKALARLRSALKPAQPGEPDEDARAKLSGQLKTTAAGFVTSLDDDFNTAGALAHLFDLVRAINHGRDAGLEAEALGKAQAVLLDLTGVLGLRIEQSPSDKSIDPFVDLLLAIRSELRANKLWALSDQVRDGLKELGVIVEDSKDGSIWYLE